MSVRFRHLIIPLVYRGLFRAALPSLTLSSIARAESDVPSNPTPSDSRVAVTDSPKPVIEPTDEYPRALSRRHFESGIRLYEDNNYSGALAEFEAAYRSYPSGSALQNVALCQKQLFRYSEAKDTLARLLSNHGSELTEAERKAVREAVDELASLVGTIRVTVSPSNANVTLDGRSLTPDERAQPVSLDVGEHRIVAEADGYAPLTRVFRVAGGHLELPVELRLVETTGVVNVIAPDPQTAIAIDGRPVAFASYTGRVQPGRHFVQIYREGYEPYEEEIEVNVGEKVRVQGELGDPTDTIAVEPNATRKPTTKRNLKGFYGLGTVSLLTLRGHPKGFTADSNYDVGYELGLRAGYRLFTPLSLEVQVASGSYVVQGHCSNRVEFSCPTPKATAYRLDTRRLGAGVRVMSEGESLRLFSVIGAGVVAHDYGAFGQHATGSDPYIQLEFGVTMNYRHSLWELSALGTFDETDHIEVRDHQPYANGGGLQLFGLSLRVGWSDWAPPRKVPPMPQTAPSAPTSQPNTPTNIPKALTR